MLISISLKPACTNQQFFIAAAHHLRSFFHNVQLIKHTRCFCAPGCHYCARHTRLESHPSAEFALEVVFQLLDERSLAYIVPSHRSPSACFASIRIPPGYCYRPTWCHPCPSPGIMSTWCVRIGAAASIHLVVLVLALRAVVGRELWSAFHYHFGRPPG